MLVVSVKKNLRKCHWCIEEERIAGLEVLIYCIVWVAAVRALALEPSTKHQVY